ncbi:pyruvate dehydrogenase [acetyl-transferring]-phosphatase 1, mitochondrial isoform X2 [Adelges cooleyi]|nr:pyruvate dehydrogenase [acetyl-transferring]-phosphatase 1, mitochondrial isoform X2 [Adelges cooleyi]
MLFGVFDGHGGPSCSHVIAKRLYEYICVSLLPKPLLIEYMESGNQLVEMQNETYDLVAELKNVYTKSLKAYVLKLINERQEHQFKMADALEKAFLQLDADILTETTLKTDSENINNLTLNVGLSGAVACVAHIDGPHLHIASAGDCLAVIGVHTDDDTWVAKVLVEEHNTDNLNELNRILSEHPSNEKDTVIKNERLLAQLAPLRAFGDLRYKWSREMLTEHIVPKFGENAIPPFYYTPPYLTAKPQVAYHNLQPRDRFLVIATDGLWDFMTPLQVVRLVGEHMSGKVTLTPLKLPRTNMKLNDINNLLLQRKESLKKKPADANACTHLIRNALGGTEYGVEHAKLSQLLNLPKNIVRSFRDDITITIVYFNIDYLRHPQP